MGKFVGGLLLGLVIAGGLFVAVPQSNIDSAKQWTDEHIVQIFAPGNDSEDNTENKEEEENNVTENVTA